ncbi:hypothetical protein RA178_06200 [Shewanella oncorhynchi]|uniref:Uncharacterized protein n=1 Tax=Shewanella oncorhynchi TaxID=2726434 RepID=A0AA50KFH7_9GAMM|nr:hypothetical protein [Shewanella oncorhynchi]WMB74203.1 hypothetical protein RA178_06200 [Shewanella oncorhynchi]
MNKYLLSVILFLMPFATLADELEAAHQKNIESLTALNNKVSERLVYLQKQYPKEYNKVIGQIEKESSNDTERKLN